jgi:hypothetical protein
LCMIHPWSRKNSSLCDHQHLLDVIDMKKFSRGVLCSLLFTLPTGLHVFCLLYRFAATELESNLLVEVAESHFYLHKVWNSHCTSSLKFLCLSRPTLWFFNPHMISFHLLLAATTHDQAILLQESSQRNLFVCACVFCVCVLCS